MQYRTADELALLMYRLTIQLAGQLNGGENPAKYDKDVSAALVNMYETLLSVDKDIHNPPRQDTGRVEGYIKGVLRLKMRLSELEKTPANDAVLPILEQAEAAGMEAIRVLMGQVAFQGEDGQLSSESPTIDRSVREIVDDLRSAVRGSNDLTEEQKKNVNGYVDAIGSILDMAHPDRGTFNAIVRGLQRYAGQLGNAVVIQAAKELIMWGIKNLL